MVTNTRDRGVQAMGNEHIHVGIPLGSNYGSGGRAAKFLFLRTLVPGRMRMRTCGHTCLRRDNGVFET